MPEDFKHPIYDTSIQETDPSVYQEAEEAEKGARVSGIAEKLSWFQDEGGGLAIKSPSMLLAIYDDLIRERKRKLYKWQYEVHQQFAFGKRTELANDESTSKAINRLAVVANNGSGKSSYTIVPCAVWLAMRYKRARCVITSASGKQLDTQVGRNLVNLCKKVNEKHGCIMWKCNYRNLTFLPTGSTIELYATDDPQKAEGYHPHEDGEMFAIFVDEAKTVTEGIYEALMRCNGITHRMDISSPGSPEGHFYRLFQNPRWWNKKVTYLDCPHINPDEVEEAKTHFGEASAVFKSAYLAEFCSVNEQLVMTNEQVMKCIRLKPVFIDEGAMFAGIDLSIGGDENVVTLCKGNSVLQQISFKYTDSTLTVEKIKRIVDHNRIECSNINVDDGGVGKPMIDMLWRDGYMVNRVRNESEARDKKTYSNKGTEIWYNLKRLIEELDIIIPNDQLLIKQLTSRYYKQGDALGRLLLESKKIARAHGHGSPDRADSLALAFANKRFPLYAHITQALKMQQKPGAEAALDELRKRRYSFSGVDAALSKPDTDGKRIYLNLGARNN